MKKRIFLLFGCLLTLTVSLCLFTACDEDFLNGNNTQQGGNTDGGSTDGGTTESAEIVFKTLTVDETNVTGTVPNATTEFSFLDEIEVKGGAKYVVALDVSGTQIALTKKITLSPGDNTVYVIQTVDGEAATVYTVVIRRRPTYNVTFYTEGGSLVPTQKIEEGSLATEPSTTRAGYSFDSWDHDFNIPITGNTEITASWTALTDTKYKVEYYHQNISKNGYDIVDSETETLSGTTGATATAEEKAFDHFTVNEIMSTLSGNISGDGSLVLKVYYTRNSYTVSSADTSYGSITHSGSHIYGTTVTSTATAELLGYEFVGWYSGSVKVSSEATYTFTVDRDIQARFEPKAELSNFNFTSTATTCDITGIKDKTVTEIIVPDYVTSIALAAFSGCSSLENITVPFVGHKKNLTVSSFTTLFGYIFGFESYEGATATLQCYGTGSLDRKTCYIPTSLKNVTVTGGELFYGAFYNCSNLTSITLPDGLSVIPCSAFEGCQELIIVTVPESVSIIDDRAFFYCKNLRYIKYKGTMEQWNDIFKVYGWDEYADRYSVADKNTVVVIP